MEGTIEDASKAEFIQGQIEKKNYRKDWLKNAEAQRDHPINFGIHMDTHHLISAEAIKISKLGKSLKNKGYVIDSLSNLVGFPSTLPGACHLGVQLHRGDHKHKRPKEEPYHKFVSSLLIADAEDILACYGRTEIEEKKSEIHKLIDPVGKKVLRKVLSYQLPLTVIFDRFKQDQDGIGCSNCHDIKPAEKSIELCSKNRNHYGEIDKKYQSSEQGWNKKEITYRGAWEPKVGL